MDTDELEGLELAAVAALGVVELVRAVEPMGPVESARLAGALWLAERLRHELGVLLDDRG